VIVGLLIVIIILVFVATLCLTNSSKYKSEKNHAFDTLQLSDGGIVSYELQSKRLKRNSPPVRPDTHNTWISEEQLRDPLAVYGSIASGINGTAPVNSMYRALTTDAIRDPDDKSGSNRYSTSTAVDTAPYVSRNGYSSPGGALMTDSPVNRLSNFNAGNRMGGDIADYAYRETDHSVYGQRNVDEDDDEAERNFARHYEFNNPNDEVYHATWRKNKEHAQPLPPPPALRPPRPDSSVSSSGTQNGGEYGLPPPMGLSLRTSQSTDFASPSHYKQAVLSDNNGSSVLNGLSSFV
jgi:hypothetical protein